MREEILAIQTVQSCIKDLNKDDFYKKQVKCSPFSGFKLAMCCLSVMKYESHFYKAQGEYSKNFSSGIIKDLEEKVLPKTLKTPDGLRLDYWDINPDNSSKYIIVCSGIGSEKSNINLQNAYVEFVNNGFGILAFDYRGRGRSGGIFSQKNALEDTITVWNYLKSKGIREKNIGIIGHSMGAGVALDFASKKQQAFVLLINPFSKASDMVKNIAQQLTLPAFIKNMVKKLPDFLIPIKNKFNNEKALKKIKSPVLIIHNTNDDTIPVEYARKLYKKNKKANRTYIELEGEDHEVNPLKSALCLDFIIKNCEEMA